MSTKVRANNIDGLRIKGSLEQDEEAVRRHIIEYYKYLYKEKCYGRPELDGLPCNHNDFRTIKRMERDSEEQEPKKALNSLAFDKSLGPEGLHMEGILLRKI